MDDKLGGCLSTLGGMAAGISYGLWSVEAAGVLSACLAGAMTAGIVTALLVLVGAVLLDVAELLD